MKLAICNETFQGWDWGRTCRFVAQAGYDGIEIAPFTLADDVRTLSQEDRAAIREQAVGAGLEITGLHWLLVSPKGLSLTSNDSDLRNATSNYLLALVDFCADVGGRVMVLGSPNQRRIPEGENKETAAKRFIESIRASVNRAEDTGIVICLEPLPPPEADFLLTLSEARELIGRADSDSVKTIFDVKSATSENLPLPDLIRLFSPLIAHVHANDANRRGPGFGETDFRPVLKTLNEVGYGGFISVEVFDYSPDPETIATESLRYLRDCLP